MAEQGDMPQLEDTQGVDPENDVWGDSDDGKEVPAVPARCLYCEETFTAMTALFSHCRQLHSLDILQVHRVHHLDDFGYIKLINFIRKTQPAVSDLVSQGHCPWSSDSFMRPEVEDDPLLQFDVEELDELMASKQTHIGAGDNEAGVVQRTIEDDHILLQRLQNSETRLNRVELSLQQAVRDLTRMRVAAQDLILAAGPGPAPSHEAVQNLTEGDDDAYFDSYSHFSIHQEMLQDSVRTESYRDSMYNNKDFFKGKVVLDVGCGTGILSMFAARAGASKVIGVELSDVIYQAMDIIRENGLEDTVTLIKGRMEDVDLPVEQVDIIISEWMGYCLLFESMLDSVLWARRHYLKDDGIVLPDHCTMTMVGIDDLDMEKWNVTYWDDVYGFRMTCMRALVVRQANVRVINPATIVTDKCIFKELDTCTCSVQDLEFTSPVQLVATSDGRITAAVVYFDIDFRLHNKVHFSTGPDAKPTHWKQTVFLLEKPIEVKKGQVVNGQFILRKNPKDPRGCKVTLSVAGTTTTYLV